MLREEGRKEILFLWLTGIRRCLGVGQMMGKLTENLLVFNWETFIAFPWQIE